VADRVLSWFFLGVVGGLMPLLAELVLRVALRRPHSLMALVGHGELLLITVVIGSSAVGTLVTSAASSRVRTVAWGLGFPCLLLLGVFYGGLRAAPVELDPPFVAAWSVIAFLVAVACGAWCITIARDPE
jgi:hypothetical protein